MRFVVGYVAFLVAFGICDAIWLGTMTTRLYRPALGDLIVEPIRYVPAALFYFGFPLGVLHFAVMPALRGGGAAGIGDVEDDHARGGHGTFLVGWGRGDPALVW